MGVIINGKELESMTHDGVEVQTWTHNGVEVYSAGKMVTYMVDSGVSYQEKVKKGQSCLAPTTFTPSKSGWTFVGWREDATASGSVLGSKLMEHSPITLYAVFKQTIALYYNGNGAEWGSTATQYGDRYYNNGNVANPSFQVSGNGFGKSNYNFQNWALNGGTRYNPGAWVTLDTSATMYAMWSYAGVPFSSTSAECTNANSGGRGSVLALSTVTSCNPDLFSYSGKYVTCKRAGYYTFTFQTKATAGADGWHVSLYVNNSSKYNAGFSNNWNWNTYTYRIYLNTNDYIEVRSGATDSINGYCNIQIVQS